MRPHTPLRGSSLSSELIKNKSIELSKAMDKMARRSFHITSRSLNRVSEYSLGKTDIKDMSERAFSCISREKPHSATSILNIIKGKPHRLRLGQTSSATTGFNQISNDFYTNIYSHKLPNGRKLPIQYLNCFEKQKCRDEENFKGKLISNIRKKTKLFNISQKMNQSQKESKYIKKLGTIILGCNRLLNPEESQERKIIQVSRYN